MPAAAAQVISLYLFAALTVSAQSNLPLSSVSGRITDSSGGGIGAASIAIVNQDNGFRRLTESQSGGAYAAGSLDPGLYKITVRRDGFRGFERFDVQLKPGAATRADFELQVGSIFETVTVRGIAPLVNSEDATVSANFSNSEIARIPTNGGGLLNLVDLVPGANVVPATRGDAGQFTVNGQRANTNYFTVDGVSANTGIAAGGLPAQSTGGTLPSVSAFGSFDSLVPLSNIEDVRVQTSTAVAQFGRMPGANVGVASQAGGNEFHGSVAYEIRNEILGANDWFANRSGLSLAPTRLNQGAASFGGPLWRNHTFFFVSYEKSALLEPFTTTAAVPSAASRLAAAPWAQQALNLFPVGNQGPLGPSLDQWTGGADQPAGLQSGSVRIDQSLGPRANLFARYSDSPSENHFGSISIDDLNLRTQSLTLGLTLRAPHGLVLDTRANESITRADSVWSAATGEASCALLPVALQWSRTPPNCTTLVRFNIDGVGDLNGGKEGSRRERQFQFVQSGSLRPTTHDIGFGIDYRRITAVRRDPSDSVGVLGSDLADLTTFGSPWHSFSPAVNAEASIDEFSVWVQDTWRPLPRLAIAAGLRWEFSPPLIPDTPVYFVDGLTGAFIKAQQNLWPAAYHDFAPRLGLAWRLDKEGGTVIRAGGGIYYESAVSIASDSLNGGPLAAATFTSALHAPFSSTLDYGFETGLRVPEVRQWNLSIERALSDGQSVSLGYVAADGRGLLRRETGGPGSIPTSLFALTTNHGFSDYQSLQAQYRRTLARNFQASAAYTWSHSIDNDSSDAFLLWAGGNATPRNDRALSDFDLRHSFSASASYQVPNGRLRGWRLSAVAHARTSFPLTVLESQQYDGIAYLNAFRPNQLPGIPLWLTDPNYPGGRRLNPAAFYPVAAGAQGTLGRNSIGGFGAWQTDLALAREFHFHDRLGLDLRLESYNVFNHPNFADPVRYLDSPLFGQSTSMLNLMLGTGSPGSGLAPMLQSGGPRMFQGTVRFRF